MLSTGPLTTGASSEWQEKAALGADYNRYIFKAWDVVWSSDHAFLVLSPAAMAQL